MPLVVQKYGGSSLATPAHIRRAAKRIQSLKESGNEVVVVVSAMGRMTDHLISLAKKTVASPPNRELDMLLTAGERISMSLLAMSLQEIGVSAISFTGSQSGIITTSDHSEAKILDIKPFRIQEALAKKQVVIIAGFQGVSVDKEVTTLGRGGSDTTAVTLAAVLKADRCEILTDVKGIYSADPRVVSKANLLTELTYEEALELSSLGAKMHARSISVAQKYGVDVWIAASDQPIEEGTRIVAKKEKKMESVKISGVATKSGFVVFWVSSPWKEFLDLCHEAKVSIRFLQATPKYSVIACEENEADKMQSKLKEKNISFESKPSHALVSVVGEGLVNSYKETHLFLQTLKECGVEPELLSLNASSITAVVAEKQKEKVAQGLHHQFLGA